LTDPQIQSVDYNRLLGRLVVRACIFMKISSYAADSFVVEGVGKSAADFAMDTLILYLNEQLPCSGDEGALFACLSLVMERDILDARRSSTAKTTTKVAPLSGSTSEDGERQIGLDDFAHRDVIDGFVEAAEIKAHFYELLEKPEPELYEIVYAVFEENALTPRDIARVIGTTPADVQNRKKRLRTFIAKHNLMKIPMKASV